MWKTSHANRAGSQDRVHVSARRGSLGKIVPSAHWACAGTIARRHASTPAVARRTVDAWVMGSLALVNKDTLGPIAVDAGRAGTGGTARSSASERARAAATESARAVGNVHATRALRANLANGVGQGAMGRDARLSATGVRHAQHMGTAWRMGAASVTSGSRATIATSAPRASSERIAT